MFQPTLPLRGATETGTFTWLAFLVSTHAPLAGSDVEPFDGHVALSRFQPTLPLRGATPSGCTGRSASSCFNPRSPCGERPGFCVNGFSALLFQPTLPLRGATSSLVNFSPRTSEFQPTLPLRGATSARRSRRCASTRFNPRSPCGERPGLQLRQNLIWVFQPTLPLRGATATSC